MKKRYLLPMLLLPIMLVSCKNNDNSDTQEYGKTNFEIALDDSSNAVITGYNGNSSEITIPSYYIYNNTTYNVIKIADNAFKDNTNLKSVKIPSMIMSIGSNAFYNTGILNSQTGTNKYVDGWLVEGDSITDKIRGIAGGALESFSGELTLTKDDVILDDASDLFSISDNAFINSGITKFVTDVNYNYIGKSAFKGSELTECEITGYIPYISDYCFAETNITSFNIPSDAFLIGKFAFNNTKLSTMEIPSTVTYVSTGAFEGCSLLTSVEFKGTTTQIAERVFRDDVLLESVTLPSLLPIISGELFYNCRALKSIDIPESVYQIKGQAFYKCRSLTNVVIPSSVSKISYQTFGECSNIVYVVIPGESKITIDDGAFKNADSIKYIYFNGDNANYLDSSITFASTFSESKLYLYNDNLAETEPGKYWYYGTDGVIETFVVEE